MFIICVNSCFWSTIAELSDEFSKAEKKATIRKELFMVQQQLNSYRDTTRRYSFHDNPEYKRTLEERANTLREELNPDLRLDYRI